MKYLFVYNADSGKLNAALHTAHKILSPSTYSCSLCALTHNLVNESAAWKAFKHAYDAEWVFLHKNEFEDRFRFATEYPVVLKLDGTFTEVISNKELNQLSDVDELISLCRKRFEIK
ncbi:MAG: GTPase [Pseudomonadota bacterium]